MVHQLLISPFLLQEIFLQLSQQDLLLIGRVCRTWQDVIHGSKVLLSALYLLPEPVSHRARSVRINPLLQSRFPAFFGGEASSIGHSSTDHCMGPWYTTHWAQSVRPWPEYPGAAESSRKTSEGHQHMLVAIQKIELDPRRTAAYRRPEASWRKMVLWQPAPTLLQVCHQTRTRSLTIHGTMRSWKFGDAANTENVRESREPFLSFGFIYDVVAEAWFCDQPARTLSILLDYSRIGTAAEDRSMISTPSVGLSPNRRRIYQALQKEEDFGGSSSCFILLEDYNRGSIPFGPKRFKNEFSFDSDIAGEFPPDEQEDYILD